MSSYGINEVCYRLVHDAPFRELMLVDAPAALAASKLTEEERAAFMGGDIGALYLHGGHPYLLGHLMRYKLFGITQKSHAESIWAAARSRGERVGADKIK